MTTDYVPPKRDPRYLWFKNLSGNVTAEVVKMGAPPADAIAIKAIADGIIAKYEATDTAQELTDSARLIEVNALDAGLPQIRAKVKNWKTLPGYASSGSEAVLQLAGTGSALDPASYQTTLKASLMPGGVRLDFTKKGVEGVSLYSRISGTANWTKIGSCNHSPFIDHTPLAQAGKPESREYMARGVIKDAELPMDSNPVIILFPG